MGIFWIIIFFTGIFGKMFWIFHEISALITKAGHLFTMSAFFDSFVVKPELI
jgi:hypothetical protein